jgi:hypothetical protein
MVYTLVNRRNPRLDASQINRSYDSSISSHNKHQSQFSAAHIPSAISAESNCQIFLYHLSFLNCIEDFCQLGCYGVHLCIHISLDRVHTGLDRVNLGFNLLFLCVHTGLDCVNLGFNLLFLRVHTGLNLSLNLFYLGVHTGLDRVDLGLNCDCLGVHFGNTGVMSFKVFLNLNEFFGNFFFLPL